MAEKHHTPEQIIHLLRRAEVERAGGQSVPQACRKLGVSEQTYYRWRKEYGGVRTDQAERPSASPLRRLAILSLS